MMNRGRGRGRGPAVSLTDMPPVAASSSSKARRRGGDSILSFVIKLACKWVKQAKSLGFWLFVFVLFYRGMDAGAFSAVNRMLSSAASVTESASNAASVLLDKSTALAEGTSSAVEASMTVAKAAWNGVDLADIKVNRSHIQVQGATVSALINWIQSDECAMVFPDMPVNATALWVATVESFAWSRPDVEVSREELSLTGFFWFTAARCHLSSGGWLVLELSMITMTFSPHWANPLWDVLDFDLDAEFDQVLQTAMMAAMHHRAVEAHSLRIQIADESFIQVGLLRLGRLVGQLVRWISMFLASGWGCGLMMAVLSFRWLELHHPASLMWPRVGLPMVLHSLVGFWSGSAFRAWTMFLAACNRNREDEESPEDEWSRVTTPIHSPRDRGLDLTPERPSRSARTRAPRTLD